MAKKSVKKRVERIIDMGLGFAVGTAIVVPGLMYLRKKIGV